MAKYQVIIGRSEEIDVVGTSLGVPAKIDTGAYRSSIHATNIKKRVVEGKEVLTFSLFGHKNAPIKRDLQSSDFNEVTVRSSNGQTEVRYEVKLKIKLANKIFTTSFSLSDRSNNLYPVLIGRTALSTRFLVDVAKTSLKIEQLLRSFSVTPKDFEEGMD